MEVIAGVVGLVYEWKGEVEGKEAGPRAPRVKEVEGLYWSMGN